MKKIELVWYLPRAESIHIETAYTERLVYPWLDSRGRYRCGYGFYLGEL